MKNEDKFENKIDKFKAPIDREKLWSKIIADEKFPTAKKSLLNRNAFLISFLLIIMIGISLFLSKDLLTDPNKLDANTYSENINSTNSNRNNKISQSSKINSQKKPNTIIESNSIQAVAVEQIDKNTSEQENIKNSKHSDTLLSSNRSISNSTIQNKSMPHSLNEIDIDVHQKNSDFDNNLEDSRNNKINHIEKNEGLSLISPNNRNHNKIEKSEINKINESKLSDNAHHSKDKKINSSQETKQSLTQPTLSSLLKKEENEEASMLHDALGEISILPFIQPSAITTNQKSNKNHPMLLIDIPRPLKWNIQAGIGIGYHVHKIGSYTNENLDTLSLLNNNTTSLETSSINISLERKMPLNSILYIGLDIMQNYRRFDFHTETESIIKNTPVESGFFAIQTDRNTYIQYHKSQFLRFNIGAEKKINIKRSNFFLGGGVNLIQTFSRNGFIYDNENNPIDISSLADYKTKPLIKPFVSLSYKIPLGNHWHIFSRVHYQFQYEASSPKSNYKHELAAINANIGFGYKF